MPSGERRDAVRAIMSSGQRELVAELERLDGGARFGRSEWHRPGGGGGQARLLENGDVFERAGVNHSAVHGERVPATVAAQHGLDPESGFFATGLSVVIHPRNPYVPAFHANFRYFESGSTWWFGGGADLTPCYGFAEDAVGFHRVLRDYCGTFDPAFHAQAKRACDEYFRLPHRGENRGIGGIFFDHLCPPGPDGWRRAAGFAAAGIATIAPAYLPIVRRRRELAYGERERQWQLYRRGRYVEFNLVHDRGTRFGLQTGGYTEAILMALPPLARWEFEFTPEPGSPEAELASFLVPRDWAGEPAAVPDPRVAR
ncbi:oxygen-dependent coproporphyrinogen oxidase [Amycolatopsis australiensis]|uniref:coproporphyrinogen oxidase n=1 Tax=Amycolatopsis australiensis TaxID=546364 RepID=A0A1K1RZ68_9PSEU|nr:oxygen-dependent coproporphyrinogen oxidase [Amycolatopsis australiensis]SFW77369.1 coproporphyrinogen oxidase [Amycolatopsis australiensis]